MRMNVAQTCIYMLVITRKGFTGQIGGGECSFNIGKLVIPEGTGPVKWQIREIFLVFGVLSVLPLPGHHARRRADGVNDGAPAAERGRTILTPSSGGA